MLEGYLQKSREWERDGGFHPYTAYPTFSSASQVQLDVTEERLCEVIEAFSLVEPIKALLFADSYLPDGAVLCAREAGLRLLDRMTAFYSHGQYAAAYSVSDILAYQKNKLTVKGARYADRIAERMDKISLLF